MRRWMIVYTTEQGGQMHVMWGDRETFETIKREGRFQRPEVDAPSFVDVYYIALVAVWDDYDKGLGRSRLS